MASAADILINVVARTARVERQLTALEKNLQKVARAARMFRDELFEFAANKLFTGLVRAFHDIKRFANEIENVAITTSMTVEEIQALNFAALQMGVAQGHVTRGLQTFAVRVAEAANGAGELKEIFKENNIELRNADGSLRTTGDFLSIFSDLLANTDDAQKRVLISSKAFGQENADLARLISKGSQALIGYVQAAQDTGNVIESDVLAKMREVDATFNRVASTIQTQLRKAVASNADELSSAASQFESIVIFLTEIAGKAPAAFNAISLGIKGVSEGLAQLQFGKIAESTAEALIDSIHEAESEIERLQALQGDPILRLFLPDDALEQIESLRAQVEDWRAMLMQLNAQEYAAHQERIRRNKELTQSSETLLDVLRRQTIPTDSASAYQQSLERLADGFKRSRDEANHLREILAKFGGDLSESAVDRINKLIQQLDPAKSQEYIEALEKIEKRYESNAQKAQRLRDILATFGDDLSAGAIENLNKAVADLEGVRQYGETLEWFKERFKSASDRAEEFKELLDSVKDKLTDKELAAAMAEYYRILGLEEIDLDSIRRLRKEVKDTTADVSSSADDMGDAFASTLSSAISAGNSLREVLQGILDDIIAIIARQSISRPIGDFLGSLLGGIFGKGISTSAAGTSVATGHGIRDSGGPVSAGSSYLIGLNRKPEIFTPSMSGSIAPLSEVIPRRSPRKDDRPIVNVTYNIEANGADEARIMRVLPPILEQTREATIAEVRQLKAEGRL